MTRTRKRSLSGWCVRHLLGQPLGEVSFDRRGFRQSSPEMRSRLEKVGTVFLGGYHRALELGTLESLAEDLNSVELETRGFAFEGAAMGLAMLDRLTPWRRNRFQEFLSGAGDAHAYMMHVGAGWVWARLPMGFRRSHQQLDPVLGWLAFDGWGFHEGYFHWPKHISGQSPPDRLTGYETRAFDQGLGRSWWFVNGGNPQLITATVNNFSADRQADLWSGVGLAATYSGIVGEETLITLRESAGLHSPAMAQGSAFAAKARQRANNLTAYTDLATRVLCGMSATDAARICDDTLEQLPTDAGGAQPAYEIWRQRIQLRLSRSRQLQAA